MTNGTTPSALARQMAADLWGSPVQSQTKIAPGIYWFSTPGHGGCVAIVDELGLRPETIEAARRTGHTGYVAKIGRRIITSERYQRVDEAPGAVEVWIGEEDCEWSTLAVVSPAMRTGLAKIGGPVSLEYVTECCARWHGDFLAAVDPYYVADADCVAVPR
jgi:hypothetical protein